MARWGFKLKCDSRTNGTTPKEIIQSREGKRNKNKIFSIHCINTIITFCTECFKNNLKGHSFWPRDKGMPLESNNA